MLLSLNRILKLKISNYCILYIVKYKEHIETVNDSLVKYRIIYMFLRFLAPLYGNEKLVTCIYMESSFKYILSCKFLDNCFLKVFGLEWVHPPKVFIYRVQWCKYSLSKVLI